MRVIETVLSQYTPPSYLIVIISSLPAHLQLAAHRGQICPWVGEEAWHGEKDDGLGAVALVWLNRALA